MKSKKKNTGGRNHINASFCQFIARSTRSVVRLLTIAIRFSAIGTGSVSDVALLVLCLRRFLAFRVSDVYTCNVLYFFVVGDATERKWLKCKFSNENVFDTSINYGRSFNYESLTLDNFRGSLKDVLCLYIYVCVCVCVVFHSSGMKLTSGSVSYF